MDTLAVQLTIPLAGFVKDFHLQVSALCRARKDEKGEAELNRLRLRLERVRASFGSPANTPKRPVFEIVFQISLYRTTKGAWKITDSDRLPSTSSWPLKTVPTESGASDTP
jgi:hypothetical protein